MNDGYLKPDEAIAFHNLATVYEAHTNYLKAFVSYRLALDMRVSELGINHYEEIHKRSVFEVPHPKSQRFVLQADFNGWVV